MSFSNCFNNVHPLLSQRLEQHNFTTPTNIQSQVIPLVVKGHAVIAQAQTGSGKTASFVLPFINELLQRPRQPQPGRPLYLILAPTRELARQINQVIEDFGGDEIKSCAVYGGVNIGPQIRQVRKANHFLVATPGRLLDHLRQETISLEDLSALVMDEADRLLDMGFTRDMQQIRSCIKNPYQGLLFSATITNDVKSLAQNFLQTPKIVQLQTTNSTIEQVCYQIADVHKAAFLYYLFQNKGWHQILIFTNTKQRAEHLVEYLNKRKIKSASIHSDKTQNARIRALEQFKAGKISILVATDIAARGIDIVQLPFVINFDMPKDAQDYVHRIGRTGRAGSAGLAISLIDKYEESMQQQIQSLLKIKFKVQEIAGWQEQIADEDLCLNPDIDNPNKQQTKKFQAMKKRVQAEEARYKRQQQILGGKDSGRSGKGTGKSSGKSLSKGASNAVGRSGRSSAKPAFKTPERPFATRSSRQPLRATQRNHSGRKS